MSEDDIGQVLGVLRDVLVKHMDQAASVPEYRIQSAVFIGRSGRLMSEKDSIATLDVPQGLRLTMRSGHEYDLLLNVARQDEIAEE